MSRTYELLCHDCRVSLWIGQGRDESAYIYTDDLHRQALRDFLFGHQNHRLEFGDDEPFSILEYTSVDPDQDRDESKLTVDVGLEAHRVDEHVQRLLPPTTTGGFSIVKISTVWTHGRAELERKSVVQIGDDQYRVWATEEYVDASGMGIKLDLVPQSDWPVAFPELYPPFSNYFADLKPEYDFSNKS